MLKADYGTDNVEKEVVHDSNFKNILESRRLQNAFRQISTGRACKMTLLISVDLVLYVRGRLIKDPSPVCH